jgi:hypothetical protein
MMGCEQNKRHHEYTIFIFLGEHVKIRYYDSNRATVVKIRASNTKLGVKQHTAHYQHEADLWITSSSAVTLCYETMLLDYDGV